MRISDWSSDVCSSDLGRVQASDRHIGDVRSGDPGNVFIGRLSAKLAAHRVREGDLTQRSEERRVGKECAVRVDLGGRRIIKKKKTASIKAHQKHVNKVTYINQ